MHAVSVPVDFNMIANAKEAEKVGMDRITISVPVKDILYASPSSETASVPEKIAKGAYAGTYAAGWNDYLDAVHNIGERETGDGNRDYVKGWNACRAAFLRYRHTKEG
jgi:hypothetical protein